MSAVVKKIIGGQVKWIADHRIDGVRYRPRFETRKQAEAFLAEKIGEVRRGTFIAPASIPTFAKAADDFLEAHANHRASTVSVLRGVIEKHLKPRLGTRRLDQITIAMMEKFRADLGATLKRNTVRAIMVIASGIFKHAIHEGLCALNPAAGMKRLHAGAQELVDGVEPESEGAAVRRADVPTPEQVKALLGFATPGIGRTFLSMAAGTGCREAELLALRWSDVDLGEPGCAGAIRISRSLSWARGTEAAQRARFYPPKTPSGIRTVPLPAALNAILRKWKLASQFTQDADLVFSNDGLPMRTGTIRRFILRDAIRKAAIPHIRLHSFRHYYASALIEAGATVVEVQRLLGHKNPGITLSTYLHFFDRGSAPTTAIEAVSASLFRDGHQVGTENAA